MRSQPAAPPILRAPPRIPLLPAQREEAAARLRQRLMLQVIHADLALDAGERQTLDGDELGRHVSDEIRHVRDAFALSREREAQIEVTHFPNRAERVAQAMAARAA